MNHFAPFALGLTLLVVACSAGPSEEPRTVGAVAEMTGRGSAALSAGTIQWINGTYGGSCTSRSGSFSVRVSGSNAMDYPALTVVMSNTACTVTLTKIVADQTYTTSSPIAMTTSYAGSASQFTGSGGLSFYANAKLSSASFASTFTVTVEYSDNSSLLTGSIGGSYLTVSSTSSTTSSTSPNYTLELTTGALTAVVSDTTSLVQSVSGTANLVQGSTSGGGYYVDQATLPSTPTFAQLDAAYTGATTTAISGSPVQIPASAFGLTGVNISSAVVRTIVIQRSVSGVHSYETFAVTFNCGGACGVCPSGESSKTDSSGNGAANVCCASASAALNCKGTCINTQVDASNCGSCGNVCSGATPVCTGGSCVASCPTGSTLCSGICVNLNADDGNCGSCGTACNTSQGQLCQSGTCGLACPWSSNDLSSIGTGDFTISFTMTANGVGTNSVINQRATCASGSFWDISVNSSGYLQVETNDGTNDTVLTASSTVIDDNKPHTVLVRRASKWLTVYVDGIANGGAALSTANWTGTLATLQVDTDACYSTNTSLSLQNVCIQPSAIYAPIPSGTYELLDNAGYAMDDPSAGGAGTNVDQVTYSQTSPNQHWTVTQVNNDQYKILAANGLALQGGTSSGSQNTLQSYTGATTQLWYFLPNGTHYNIVNVSSGLAVDDNNNGGSGVSLLSWTWSTGNANQYWTLKPPFANGTYEFVDDLGYAFDDPSGGGAGTISDQVAYSGANEQWTITQVSGLQYKVIAASGAALTSGTTNGTLAPLSSYTGAPSQLWTFQQNGQNGSTYNLTNVASGLVLDDNGGGSGVRCYQGEFSPNSGNRFWQVVQSVAAPIASGNPYALVNYAGTSLDDPSNGGAGTTPDQVTYSGTNQQWTVTLVSGLQYKIIAHSGAALTASSTQGNIPALSAYSGGNNNQLWVFVPAGSYYNVVNVGTGLALDDNGAGSGTPHQWAVDPTNFYQRWTVILE